MSKRDDLRRAVKAEGFDLDCYRPGRQTLCRVVNKDGSKAYSEFMTIRELEAYVAGMRIRR